MTTRARRDAGGERSTAGRRLPVGAEVLPGGGVHFRVWAPARRRVEVVVEDGPGARGAHALAAEGNGWFADAVPAAAAGTRYRFRLDGDPALAPDPASRFQPEGPHGPSEVVDPTAFRWTDGGWPGLERAGQVVYEMHVGAFTPEGTWAAAERELPALADLGVTVLEVMPVAEFPGRFGWGYDGVDLFAPTRLYGRPDDVRRFVDRAHALGLGVVLDVVYNHLGPDGNYLRRFTDAYFSTRHTTDWGDALNYDGPQSGPVRELFAANAAHWIAEYHLDGLRLDATQDIHDDSTPHVLAEIGRAARAAAPGRRILLIGENEPQEVIMVRPVEEGGRGLDALWNDDFHHAAMVALTGRREAYYVDYRGSPQELVSAAKWGYLYQGQRYEWQDKPRGTPAYELDPARLVNYLQNHDQVANSARGQRVHELTSPARLRAATALLLLAPATPMLFMGQEFAASSPFLFFADHEPGLAAKVRTGRADFLSQFPSVASARVRPTLPDPADEATFRRCVLDHGERETHAWAWALHRDLLALRREDSVLARLAARGGRRVDGAVLGERALVLRFFGERGDDRLLVVNLGADEALDAVPEPLLAPPAGRRWRERWTSEDPRYGGGGTPGTDERGRWRLVAESAVLYEPERA